jgi:hypothetical protein
MDETLSYLRYFLSLTSQMAFASGNRFPPPPNGPILRQIAAPMSEVSLLPIVRCSPDITGEPLREVVVKGGTPVFGARATAPRLPMIPSLTIEK